MIVVSFLRLAGEVGNLDFTVATRTWGKVPEWRNDRVRSSGMKSFGRTVSNTVPVIAYRIRSALDGSHRNPHPPRVPEAIPASHQSPVQDA